MVACSPSSSNISQPHSTIAFPPLPTRTMTVPSYRILLIKYLRVACLALSLMSLVFSATSYSTSRWSVSANDLAVDKFNLPLTFADRHTKDTECRSKICRVLDERKDALLVGRIYRGLSSVCEMVQRRTGETLVLTCARTDDNFIDVNVIRRLQLSAVVISTFSILLAAWLLAIGLHRPVTSGKQITCGGVTRKLNVVKFGECTLVLQITSIVLYLLTSLLLAMGSVMYVSNKQVEEVVSYSFFFSTVAFSCHLVAALAVGTDFFICASVNNRAQQRTVVSSSGPSDFGHHHGGQGVVMLDANGGGGGGSGSNSSSSSGVGSSCVSTMSTLGIGFRPITLAKPSNMPSATPNPMASSSSSSSQEQSPSAQQHQQTENRSGATFEPPSFMSCMRYHQ